jgi:hypothetical protein
MIPLYAVVPSNGREYLQGCLASLLPQVDVVILVRNADFTPPGHDKIVVIDWMSPKKLPIHEWWNCGLRFAAALAGGQPHDVLICNDDALVPIGVPQRLSEQMRATTAVLASAPHPGSPYRGLQIYRPRDAHILNICGWCFMLRGEAGLRADTRFSWWYGDTDLEWQARESGGALLCPDCMAANLKPDGHTGIMAEEIKADEVLFREKWQL